MKTILNVAKRLYSLYIIFSGCDIWSQPSLSWNVVWWWEKGLECRKITEYSWKPKIIWLLLMYLGKGWVFLAKLLFWGWHKREDRMGCGCGSRIYDQETALALKMDIGQYGWGRVPSMQQMISHLKTETSENRSVHRFWRGSDLILWCRR